MGKFQKQTYHGQEQPAAREIDFWSYTEKSTITRTGVFGTVSENDIPFCAQSAAQSSCRGLPGSGNHRMKVCVRKDPMVVIRRFDTPWNKVQAETTSIVVAHQPCFYHATSTPRKNYGRNSLCKVRTFISSRATTEVFCSTFAVFFFNVKVVLFNLSIEGEILG